MTATQAYWFERMMESSVKAQLASSVKHRDVYLRLVDTYAALAAFKHHSANDNP